MKKLIPLILLTALVGCAETIYPDRETCALKELKKFDSGSAHVVYVVEEYCKRFPKAETN